MNNVKLKAFERQAFTTTVNALVRLFQANLKLVNQLYYLVICKKKKIQAIRFFIIKSKKSRFSVRMI